MSSSLDAGFSISLGAHISIGIVPILLFGSKEQKEKYLPPLAKGEKIASFALTEPDAGSHASSLKTSAKKVPGGYLIQGSKMFITNAPVADVFVLFAKTDPNKTQEGISSFILEKEDKGLKVAKPLKKLGHHTSLTAELILEEVWVPDDRLLGDLNQGYTHVVKNTLEYERLILMGIVSGGIEGVLKRCYLYARERKQFYQPIFSFYAIKEKLAKMWVYLQAGRRYAYYLARKKEKGDSILEESALLKIFLSEVGEEIALDAVQILGGYGYMKEYHVERFYRDIKLYSIGAGTTEIQRYTAFKGFKEEKLSIEDEELLFWKNILEKLYPKISSQDQEVSFSFVDIWIFYEMMRMFFLYPSSLFLPYEKELFLSFFSSRLFSSLKKLSYLLEEKEKKEFLERIFIEGKKEEKIHALVEKIPIS